MLLSAKNLSFWYNKESCCFKNVSFDLKDRESIAILGLNGQGKSTLLYCLMGILEPKEGSVIVNEEFAYLPQLFVLPFSYNVLEVILMGRASKIGTFKRPSKKDIDIAKNAASLLECEALLDRDFNSLSGGQKQLVLFARALCKESKVLILDEPASALDLKNQDRVLLLIDRLKREFGLSIIFTTHQPNHALAVADRALILHSDLSFKFGATKEIVTEKEQEKLYDIKIKNISLKLEKKQIITSVPIYTVELK